MQDSPNLTLNNAKNERIQIVRVRYLGEEMFHEAKIAKLSISDF